MKVFSDEDLPAFDLYFAMIVAMNNHPGNKKEPVQKMSLRQCAEQACEMMDIRKILISEDTQNVPEQ